MRSDRQTDGRTDRYDETNSRSASHKSKPSSVPRGIVDSYSTLDHEGGGNSCGGYTLIGDATTHGG